MNLGRLNKFLRNKNLKRQTKKQVYKTVIRPTVLYACETWDLTKEWKQRLEIWERKILRKLYGGSKEQEQWITKINKEVEEVLIWENQKLPR